MVWVCLSFGLFGSRTRELPTCRLVVTLDTAVASSRQYELQAEQCQVSRFEILVEFQPVLVDSVLSSGSFSWNTELMLIMGNAPSAKGRRKSGILTPASCWLLETAESRWVSKYSPTLTMPANTANTTNNATTNITIDTLLLCFNKHQAVSKVCDSRTGLDARPSDVCLLQSNSVIGKHNCFKMRSSIWVRFCRTRKMSVFMSKKLSRRVLWPN